VNANITLEKILVESLFLFSASCSIPANPCGNLEVIVSHGSCFFNLRYSVAYGCSGASKELLASRVDSTFLHIKHTWLCLSVIFAVLSGVRLGGVVADVDVVAIASRRETFSRFVVL